MMGSMVAQLPPARPHPIRGMCTEAPSKRACAATFDNPVLIASQRTGAVYVAGVATPCWPIRLATTIDASTGTNWTSPSTGERGAMKDAL